MRRWMMKTMYKGSLACPADVFCAGGALGAGAGLALTDITLALGGWHKALRCLGSCGLPAEAFLEQALFSDVSALSFWPFPYVHSDQEVGW